MILVNILDRNKKVKEKHKILLKDYFLFDDINIREYIQYEKERIVWKRHQKQQQQQSSVTQKNWTIFENLKVPDQTYLTISIVVIFKFV